MFALVSPEKIKLPPGSVVRLPATWDEYQALSHQRGKSSIVASSTEMEKYCENA
jgi:hypothetical protein